MSRYVVRRPVVYRWGLVSWFQWRATLVSATRGKRNRHRCFRRSLAARELETFSCSWLFALFLRLPFLFSSLSLSLFSFTAARVIAPFRPFLARANLRQVPTASNRDDLRSNEYSRRSLDILERLFEPVRSDSSPFYRCSEPAKQSSRACSFDFSLARDSTARNESTSDLTRV